MNVSATFDSNEYVQILDIDVNGCMMYVTYKTSADQLKVMPKLLDIKTGAATRVATNTTVN